MYIISQDYVWLTFIFAGLFFASAFIKHRAAYYMQIGIITSAMLYIIVDDVYSQYWLLALIVAVRLSLAYGLFAHKAKLKVIIAIIALFILITSLCVINVISTGDIIPVLSYGLLWFLVAGTLLIIELYDSKGKIFLEQLDIIHEQKHLIQDLKKENEKLRSGGDNV